MKQILFVYSLLFLIACSTDPSDKLLPVPYSVNPETPNQKLLDSLALRDISELQSELKTLDNTFENQFYTLNKKPFTGWVKEDLSASQGVIRYLQIDSGWVNWQVGYFINGQLECDFHQINGKKHGNQRRWAKNGTPYTNNNLMHGIQDGEQRRWYPNGQLEWFAKYNQGELLEQVYYSTKGKIQSFDGDFEIPYLNSNNFDNIKPIYSQGWGNVYRYFIYFFDSTSVKRPLDTRGSSICHFKQQFAEKIELEMIQCNAGVSSVSINFPPMSIPHAKKIVRGFFQNETAEMVEMRNAAVPYLWSSDTLYYTEEGIPAAPGCDFHFEPSDSNMLIKFYCTD
jgi:antitoxin component YwqK of YwqJK toxin-antitoxin module